MWGSELACFLFPTLTALSCRGKRALAVGPPSATTLPGFAEADCRDWQELQTGHLDTTPMVYTLGFISAAFTEIQLC